MGGRVLALLVCIWLVAHAVHIHTPSDTSKPAESVQHCDFRVALGTAAPAQVFAILLPPQEIDQFLEWVLPGPALDKDRTKTSARPPPDVMMAEVTELTDIDALVRQHEG